MSTKIEVLVAHYNGSAFIREQLESIQLNTLPFGCELYITVFDDQSRLEEFEKLLVTCSRWENVKVVRNEENLGVIRTFEKALADATAPYVMLCDQDDVWLPEKISLTLSEMRKIENGGPALVFTELRTVDRNLKTITDRMIANEGSDPLQNKHALLFQNKVTGCTVMVNRALIQLALPFPAPVPMHDHWLAICAAFGGTIAFVDQPTILYRQHQANLVGQPKRTIAARAQKPFHTLARFNFGLRQKGLQAIELAKRLPENQERKTIARIGDAFLHRSISGLRFLIRTGVFQSDLLALPLISALYLMPVRPSQSKDPA
jgi:glycosyltransferase involved in cell wall biosynthesis